jgi:hypothetical protein
MIQNNDAVLKRIKKKCDHQEEANTRFKTLRDRLNQGQEINFSERNPQKYVGYMNGKKFLDELKLIIGLKGKPGSKDILQALSDYIINGPKKKDWIENSHRARLIQRINELYEEASRTAQEIDTLDLIKVVQKECDAQETVNKKFRDFIVGLKQGQEIDPYTDEDVKYMNGKLFLDQLKTHLDFKRRWSRTVFDTLSDRLMYDQKNDGFLQKTNKETLIRRVKELHEEASQTAREIKTLTSTIKLKTETSHLISRLQKKCEAQEEATAKLFTSEGMLRNELKIPPSEYLNQRHIGGKLFLKDLQQIIGAKKQIWERDLLQAIRRHLTHLANDLKKVDQSKREAIENLITRIEQTYLNTDEAARKFQSSVLIDETREVEQRRHLRHQQKERTLQEQVIPTQSAPITAAAGPDHITGYQRNPSIESSRRSNRSLDSRTIRNSDDSAVSFVTLNRNRSMTSILEEEHYPIQHNETRFPPRVDSLPSGSSSLENSTLARPFDRQLSHPQNSLPQPAEADSSNVHELDVPVYELPGSPNQPHFKPLVNPFLDQVWNADTRQLAAEELKRLKGEEHPRTTTLHQSNPYSQFHPTRHS